MNKSEIYTVLRKKYLTEDATGETLEAFSDIFHTACKTIELFDTHEKIRVSISGGSDSDCMLHFFCTYFPEHLDRIYFVFSDTGIEYKATRKHLAELETKYGIKIHKVRGLSVVTVVNKYGLPLLSKEKALMIHYYMQDKPYAINFVNGLKKQGCTEKEKALADYCKENNIKVSERCCYFSKKAPLDRFGKKHGIDLYVTGERKCESGIRSTAHKSCFEEHKNGAHKYMPLWWWSNATKEIFKEKEGIVYSECYEKWGMKRTGCVGCPFNSKIGDDLVMIKKHEPETYRLIISIFGKAYKLTDKFDIRRKKCIPDELKGDFENV